MNKYYKIIILISFISLLIIIKLNYKNYENYNERLTNVNVNKCAEFCKTRSGCFAFAHNKENNICYPSKSLIEGKPINPEILYLDEFNKKNLTCNKMEPVLVEDKNLPFDQRRKNSIYVCSENQDKYPQWYLHSDSKFTNLGEGKNIDFIFDIDKYSVMDYEWPINKYNLEQTKLLKTFRKDQEFAPSTITNIKNSIK